MLKATIIGNVGSDATIKTFGGRNYLSFSVAHSYSYTDESGERIERTQWVSCLRRVGENSTLINYVTKGKKVYVEGNLTAKVYESSYGTHEVSLSVRVSHLELLGGRTENSASTSGTFGSTSSEYTAPIADPVKVPSQFQTTETSENDDLPF